MRPAFPPEIDRWRIAAPEIFALDEAHHDKLIAFLESFRDALARGDEFIYLDFSATKRMVAGGTLLFYSELMRARSMYPSVKMKCVPAKASVVNQILVHLGIYAQLGYESAVVPERLDVTTWKIASSHEIDGRAVGEPLKQFHLDDIKEKHLFRGASEAMINAVNHAYEAPRDDRLTTPEHKNWWMFFRRHDGKLFIAVCDLGIGIPRSLPLKYTAEVVDAAMSVLSAGHRATDARLIQAAMELQRTRTERRGRGRGLNDLRRIVDEVPGGQLYLFSNRGLVVYQGGAFTRRNFRRSILGTVVVWVIPLNEHDHE